MSYTLHLGDCLEVMRGMADNSTDAIITDLPYNVTSFGWDEVIPFAPMWAEVTRVLKLNGAFVTTANQPFTSALVMSNPQWFKYEMVWIKTIATNFLNAKKQPLRNHESILVFSAGQTVYNPQMRHGKPYIDCRAQTERRFSATNQPTQKTPIVNYGERYPLSTLEYSNSNQDSEHPTQKPVALYQYLIRTYTNPGDTVLDFCCGSGTTLVAAIKEGRRGIGIEKDAHYHAIAQRRIEDAAAQPMLFEVS